MNTFGANVASLDLHDSSEPRWGQDPALTPAPLAPVTMLELHPRPTPSVAVPFAIGLAVVDVLVVAGFIAFGLFTHGIDPWLFPDHTARTATPFVIGWLLVAPLAGAYGDRLLASYRRTTVVVFGTWLVATLLGGAIRATSLFPGSAPPSFLLVNAGIGLAFVLPWRLAATAGHRRWRGRRAPQ